MAFRITGLDPRQFRPLFGLSDEDLARQGAVRCTVDTKPGFPDRVTLKDAEIGESIILLNYEHLPAASPYRSRHAIYVRECEAEPFDATDELPEVMAGRVLALRGIDADGHIRAAEIAEGDGIEAAIERLLAEDGVAYIHAHFAARGCYAARIDRT